jgi:hypothetical protein
MDDGDMAVRRFHLTNRPLTKVHGGPHPQPFGRKPGGLWWAVGSAWLDHVSNPRSSGITKRLREVDRAYEITLKPDARILTIATAADLMDVTLRYGVPAPWTDPSRLCGMWESKAGGRWLYRPKHDGLLASHNRCSVSNLDWAAVAADYLGVDMLITPGGPLADKNRTHFEWSDIDWAVPSGCVWDVRALDKVVRVPLEELLAAAREVEHLGHELGPVPRV